MRKDEVGCPGASRLLFWRELLNGSQIAVKKRVIFLAITSYEVFPDKKECKSDRVVLDDEPREPELKDFYFTFVELPKFTKKPDELEIAEDKWYYFLKHAQQHREVEPLLADNPEIKEAYHVLEQVFWTEAERQDSHGYS